MSKNLPEPAEVEILEALITKPAPILLNPAMDSGELANKAAEHDDRQGSQQPDREPLLDFGSRPLSMGAKKIPAAR